MVTTTKTIELMAEHSGQLPSFCKALMAFIDRHLTAINFTADYVYLEFQTDLNAATLADDICTVHRLLRPKEMEWTHGSLRLWWD